MELRRGLRSRQLRSEDAACLAGLALRGQENKQGITKLNLKNYESNYSTSRSRTSSSCS